MWLSVSMMWQFPSQFVQNKQRDQMWVLKAEQFLLQK